MLEQYFRHCFYAGFAPGVAILLLQKMDLVPYLLHTGVVHVGILTFFAFRLPPSWVNKSAETLHKAGFLHTLLSLGAAILTSGNIMAANSLTPQTMSLVLLPMGAALVPHALGLMAGHALQMDAKDDIEAELDDLKKREELHRQINGSLTAQQKHQNEVTAMCGKILAEFTSAKDAVNDMASAVKNAEGFAQKANDEWSKVATAAVETTEMLGQITTLHKEVIALFESDLLKRGGESKDETFHA